MARLLVAPWLVVSLFAGDVFTDERNTVSFHEARVKQRPDDAGPLRSLASALIRLAEVTTEARYYDQSWQNLDKADVLEPGNPDTMRTRARLLLSRHRFSQALAVAVRTLEIVPDDIDLMGIAGDASFETGDYDAAEARYRKLHTYSPQVNTWARLAQVAEARQQWEEADKMLVQAMETGARKGAPAEAIAWCLAVLGEVKLKRGNRDEARRLYAAGLEKQPGHPLVLEHLAELEMLEGNLEASASAYRKLLARRRDPVNTLRLSKVVAARGDAAGAEALRREAREWIEQAVAGGNEGFLRPLAELELEAGKFNRAATLAARDVALRPTVESRAMLAKILAAAAAAGMPVNGW